MIQSRFRFYEPSSAPWRKERKRPLRNGDQRALATQTHPQKCCQQTQRTVKHGQRKPIGAEVSASSPELFCPIMSLSGSQTPDDALHGKTACLHNTASLL